MEGTYMVWSVGHFYFLPKWLTVIQHCLFTAVSFPHWSPVTALTYISFPYKSENVSVLIIFFFKNHSISVGLTYKKLHVFNVYNLMSLELSTDPWNRYHNQCHKHSGLSILFHGSNLSIPELISHILIPVDL